jgi:hypothetical protein
MLIGLLKLGLKLMTDSLDAWQQHMCKELILETGNAARHGFELGLND